MQNTLYIPKIIKVGCQKRADTFTGQLAYIIYYDDKGKLRKETSWNSWRDESIEPIEFTNEPQSNFTFNKGVERSGEWGSGRSVIRVHDSREFEFEISVDNLIGILMHSDVSKRSINEECVFAWCGTELVLLPINSEAYKASVVFTAKQANKISTKELVKGRQYAQKSSDEILTYVGFFNWMETECDASYNKSKSDYVYRKHHINKGKKHIFYNPTNEATGYKWYPTFKPTLMNTLSHAISDDINPNYAEIVDKFYATTNSQVITGFDIDFELMKLLLDDGKCLYRNYPRMQKIVGNEIHNVYMSNSYYNSTFDSVSFTRLTWTFNINDKKELEITRCQYPYKGGNSYGYGNYSQTKTNEKDITNEIHPYFLTTGTENVTIPEYISLMTTLGYGQLQAVLDNGTKITYDI